ncbi:hypothetical protein [Actinoallomurus rhizosphaericola]|uniref:hypothetical protein n=1 Tax=Actinoallomurus rhizosphaericola TaxID=2952536 RepID=UPI0020908C59|nr:hypothetical protein [Actinoallomurus rhizosphaericola]MCO5993223.1 hypothetical protein [Actinoallomurus rhizosphaericola]
MPFARTLREAELYADLLLSATASGDEPEASGGEPAGGSRPRTTLTEGPDAWTLRIERERAGQGDPVEVVIPYASEATARDEDLMFGDGPSELIDAGQWVQVAAAYARRAMLESLDSARDTSDDDLYRNVVQGWEVARAALREAARFLPPDADEVPETAFWSDLGTLTRQEAPERFTRARLEEELAFYERSLRDFRNLRDA